MLANSFLEEFDSSDSEAEADLLDPPDSESRGNFYQVFFSSLILFYRAGFNNLVSALYSCCFLLICYRFTDCF
jgi:hypothetical protein